MIDYFVGAPSSFNCLLLITQHFWKYPCYWVQVYVDLWEYLITAEYKSSLAT